ncbi:hypothetical protein ACX0G9_21980 [Flavitalea flava]
MPHQSPIGNGKKAGQLEALMQEADPASLKSWVKETLVKNKDLEFSFLQRFASPEKHYTPLFIKRLTHNAVKTVLKNREKANAAEVKKIVDLWTEIHDPIITHYCADLTNKKSFLHFNALVESCEEAELTIRISGNKITNYIKNLLAKVMEKFQNLQNDDSWNIATGFIADRLPGNLHTIRTYYLSFLTSLIDSCSWEKKKTLAEKLIKRFATSKPQDYYNGGIYIATMFTIIKNCGLFTQYYHLFRTVRYKNGYNEELISLLIQNKHLELAEKYCREQIQDNYQEEQTLVYQRLLKEIDALEKKLG